MRIHCSFKGKAGRYFGRDKILIDTKCIDSKLQLKNSSNNFVLNTIRTFDQSLESIQERIVDNHLESYKLGKNLGIECRLNFYPQTNNNQKYSFDNYWENSHSSNTQVYKDNSETYN